MQQSNGTRTQYSIVLDREKIEREDEYDYNDLVEYLDTELGKHGFFRKSCEDCLCYCNDEPNNFFNQMAGYLVIVKQPAIYDNLKDWQLEEFEDNDFVNPAMVENVLETIAAHGGNPLFA